MPVLYALLSLLVTWAPLVHAQSYVVDQKVENLTLPKVGANSVLITDANKKVTSSTVTATDIAQSLLDISELFNRSLPTGGSSGQVLSKVNGTDYNTQWSSVSSLALTALTGDVSASGVGSQAATIANGAITNAKVSAAAGIGVTKLAALTASRPVITDSSGFLTTEAALAIARGGTANASIGTSAGGVVYMDGSKMAATGIGTTGQFLTSQGAAAPTWTTVSASGKVTGEVFSTAASSCPSGSVAANGTSALRTGGTECGGGSCANLYASIGTTYGSADGTHFTFPDIRGITVTGAGSQTISGTTYTRTQGAYQRDQMQGHRHAPPSGAPNFVVTGSGSIPSGGGTIVGTAAATGDPTSDGTNGTPRTGAETRMANVALLFCIVY